MGAVSYLALANLEDFVVAVNDGSVGTGGTRERNALVVGGQLDSSLGGDGIGGIEAGSMRDAPEAGKVFQGHLGWTILTLRGREGGREGGGREGGGGGGRMDGREKGGRREGGEGREGEGEQEGREEVVKGGRRGELVNLHHS